MGGAIRAAEELRLRTLTRDLCRLASSSNQRDLRLRFVALST
jgi:hypothetical protein